MVRYHDNNGWISWETHIRDSSTRTIITYMWLKVKQISAGIHFTIICAEIGQLFSYDGFSR